MSSSQEVPRFTAFSLPSFIVAMILDTMHCNVTTHRREEEGIGNLPPIKGRVAQNQVKASRK